MYRKVNQTFYGLSAVALMAILFIATPNNSVEVKQFQNSIVQQVKVAVNQIFGSLDPVSDLATVWNGNQLFYAQSTNEFLAMIPVVDEIPTPIQSNLDHLAFNATQVIAMGINQVLGIDQSDTQSLAQGPISSAGEVLGVQTLEAPASPAQPQDEPVTAAEPPVATKIESVHVWTGEHPVNTQYHPWVTLEDNVTGEEYCVAIYDNQVNKYPGACQYSYR